MDIMIIIVLGIMAMLSMITTLGFAYAVTKMRKPLLKQHKYAAYATITLALIHGIFVYLYLTGA